MLRALGHNFIVSVDIDSDKRMAAIKAGATAAVDGSGDETLERLLGATKNSVLAVIDFVNIPSTALLALNVLRKGGKMVQVGIMGGTMQLPLTTLVFKAATIMGSNTGNLHHLREVVRLAKEKRLQPLPVSTMNWENAGSALHRLKCGEVVGRLVLTTNNRY